MANEFSTGKSIFILAIVAGCFAVLWPNIFYPMLFGSYSNKNTISNVEGCCDVIFDRDVNAIKIMTQLCEKILYRQEDFNSKFFRSFREGKLTKEIIDMCQKTVMHMCGIDITEFLKEKVRLGTSYKQVLGGIRSLNISLCLKENFGLSMGQIGLPRQMRIWGVNVSKHLRQERPPHLRPEMMHPALREKGRAIPQSHGIHSPVVQQPRPGPVPGLRPPMGGAGHVVPPPKGSGTMGIVMPMYTIGIVVFFLYTMMRLMFKKSDDSASYDGFTPDPEFRRVVFDNSSHRCANNKELSEDVTKLGDLELDMLRKRLQETEKAMERIVAKMMSLPHSSLPPKISDISQSDALAEPLEGPELLKEGSEVSKEVPEPPKEATEPSKETPEPAKEGQPDVRDQLQIGDEETEEEGSEKKGVVKVLGMEMTESCEGGAKWSRPSTPLSRPSTPQNIYLSGSLPSQSQLLVSDSHTETLSAQDNAVVLTGKVTLSLIGLIEADAKADVEDHEAQSQVVQTEEDTKNEEKLEISEETTQVKSSKRPTEAGTQEECEAMQKKEESVDILEETAQILSSEKLIEESEKTIEQEGKMEQEGSKTDGTLEVDGTTVNGHDKELS